MSVLYRKLLRDIWRMRAQALAIALVMACGVATTVLSLGTIRSLEQTAQSYYTAYGFADIFTHLNRAPQSLMAPIREIPGVAAAQGRIAAHVLLDMPKMPEPARAQLLSLPDASGPRINGLHIKQGRLPSPGDQNEAVVSEGFAQAHGLRSGDTVAANLNGHWQELSIVGIGLSPEFVYTIAPGSFMPDDELYGIFWLNRDGLEAAFDLDGAFNSVVIRTMRNADEQRIIERIDTLLEPYGSLGAYARKDQLSHWYVRNELDQLSQFTFIFPTIFMAVAAFLLNATLSRITQLERPQIGLMKALGYGRNAIALHYLELGLIIALLAAIAGIFIGVWFGRDLTELYAAFFRFPVLEYHLTLDVIAVSVLVSIAAAIVGALGAVLRVVRLAPAEAMRPPSPAVYRRGMSDRLGVTKRLSQPSRMILRHMRRHPVRAALTILAIGIAVAVLIMSRFGLDSMNYIIRAQYEVAQRDDMTVSLAEPASRSAYFTFTDMPGVLLAEPFRSVAVKLHHGTAQYRTTIVGIENDAVLYRMIDRNARPVTLSKQGLILSTTLAGLINAEKGDVVRVEMMQGRRLTRDVVVAQVVEEFIGATAYMNISALNRLMLEGDVISGVHLAIDPAAEPGLYQLLKTTPAVAGIAIHDAQIENFYESTGEFMTVIITIYVFFSSLIAIGVVYNGARIALSERQVTLATLRVLGFRLSEIAYILLGELALLTLLAIPTGWMLGYGLASLVSEQLDTELYRIPLVINKSTYGFATCIVLIATALSGYIVGRKLSRLDLIAALKTRE